MRINAAKLKEEVIKAAEEYQSDRRSGANFSGWHGRRGIVRCERFLERVKNVNTDYSLLILVIALLNTNSSWLCSLVTNALLQGEASCTLRQQVGHRRNRSKSIILKSAIVNDDDLLGAVNRKLNSVVEDSYYLDKRAFLIELFKTACTESDHLEQQINTVQQELDGPSSCLVM